MTIHSWKRLSKELSFLFCLLHHELYKDGSWRNRRNVLPALDCSRFFSSCVFLHCHSAVPSAVKRWKKQLTEEHPQGNTSSVTLARRLFSKHLLGFFLLQLGQPAAKGHIQSHVDVLRKTSAAGMQPTCHFAKFQPVFHVLLLSYPLPDECSFRIILKGQQLTFVRTKQSSAEQRPVFRYCTAQPRRGRDCRDRAVLVCRKFISRPLERCGPMMVFRLPQVWGVILYCGLISFSSRSACPHLSII